MAYVQNLSGLDLTGIPLKALRFENLAADPGSPSGAGHGYYSTASGSFKFYNGSVWKDPLARGDHTGTQLAATISNLATTVQAYTLNSFAAPTANVPFGGFKITGLSTSPSGSGDSAEYSWVLSRPLSAFAAPTGNVAWGGFKITGLGTPTTAGDAATYDWVTTQIQSAAAGIASKPPVRLVLTSNDTLSGLAARDGITPVANDRVLAVGQTTASQNGVYNAASGAWTRTTIDGPAPGEIETGAMWLVTEGTAGAGTQYRVSTTGAITVGTTSLSIVQFGAGSSYTASNGLQLSGSAFSVKLPASSGLVADGTGTYLDTAIAVRKFSATLTADSSTTSFPVTHSLGTQDITVSVRNSTTNAAVELDWTATSTTAATFVFAVAPTTGTNYRVVIHG